VSGTVSNQGRLYDRFDAVVLLSAPADVLLQLDASLPLGDVVEQLVEIGHGDPS
jgi:hypothetical protein